MGTPFKMKGMDFGVSPVKQKDYIKYNAAGNRIDMMGNEHTVKARANRNTIGAPKNKRNINYKSKGNFNFTGSKASTTPKYNPKSGNFNWKGSSKAGGIWQKGKHLVKKGFKGASKSNILGLMLGSTTTARADQPKLKKGDTHYRDPKKSIF